MGDSKMPEVPASYLSNSQQHNSRRVHYEALLRVRRRKLRQVLGSHLSGNEVTVRFGRIGTEGQTQTKTLPDAEAAVKHAEKLIASKTAKGYAETVTR